MFRNVKTIELATSAAEGGATWPWFSTTYLNSATLPPNLSLGELCNFNGGSADGNTFMVVKAGEALAQGNVVSMTANTIGQVSGTVTSASSTTSVITTNITTVAYDVGAKLFLWIANTTSSGGGKVLRPATLVSNGAATAAYGTNSVFNIAPKDFTVPVSPAGPDALTLAATNADVAILIRPYTVGLNTATTVPCGIAQGTVTSGYYTLVQVGGEAGVLTADTTPGLVIGVPAIGAAAGVIIGSTAGATPYIGGGVITPHLTYNASAAILVPCHVNFTGNV